MNSVVVAVLAVLAPGAPEPAVTQALALRGGAMLLPLRHEEPARGWPSTMRVRWQTSRGTTIATAQLVWVEQQVLPVRHWGANPSPSRVRPIRGHEPTIAAGSGAPYLLFDVPHIDDGELLVGSAIVQLHWSDLPPAMPDLRLDTGIPLGPAPQLVRSAATPGLEPTERWRWELLCAVDGQAPPPLPEDLFNKRVVLHTVGRWRLLMHGLAHLDRGMARAVQELLTARVAFQGEEIAVWETSPGRLAALLAMQGGSVQTRTEALSWWLEQAIPVTAWLQEPMRTFLSLVVANSTLRTQVVETSWVLPGDIPLAVQVAPRSTATEPLERPDEGIVLGLQSAGIRAAFALPSRVLSPEPPGLPIGPFLPVLTLHDARATTQPLPPPSNVQTWAQVRRVLGRWEVLLDCRTPMLHTSALPDAWHLDGLRGHEAVLLRLHRDGQEITVVAHPGGHLCSIGSAADLDVRIAHQANGWICRVQFPEYWTEHGFGLELVRLHGGSHAMETAVMAGTPWAPLPGPILIDGGAWDQGVPLVERPSSE
jgi:hypothetical protein